MLSTAVTSILAVILSLISSIFPLHYSENLSSTLSSALSSTAVAPETPSHKGEPLLGFRPPNTSVYPGVAIVEETTRGTCTAGFTLKIEGETFLTTAGHCGRGVGSRWEVTDSKGNRHFVGTTVYAKDDVTYDWSLIRLNPQVSYTSSFNIGIPLSTIILNSHDLEHGTQLCKVGNTTGFTCGQVLTTYSSGRIISDIRSDRGDSGGPVVAVINNVAYPVGLIEGGYSNGTVGIQALYNVG